MFPDSKSRTHTTALWENMLQGQGGVWPESCEPDDGARNGILGVKLPTILHRKTKGNEKNGVKSSAPSL